MSYLDIIDRVLEKQRESEKATQQTDISLFRLSEIAKRNMAIEIYSEVLGCEIWLCSNNEMATRVKEDNPGTVIYTADELRRLIKLNPDPEVLRNVHIAKTIFAGSKIIDSRLKENKK